MNRLHLKKQRMHHLALGGVLIMAFGIWMSCENAATPTGNRGGDTTY